MKWLKRILIVVGVLIVLALVVPVVALFTIEPNSYKSLIVAQANKATGRQLNLEGDLKLSLFPRLGLSLGTAQLSNAKGFGDTPFAKIESAEVSISAWPPGPLLKGQIEADKLTLKGLTLDLHTTKDGRTNWDDFTEKSAKPDGKKGEASTGTSEKGDKGKALTLALEGVDISDTQVRWRDDRDGTDIVIAPVNLRTGNIRPGEPFDLEFDLAMKSGKPASELKLDLTAAVIADLAGERYRLEGLKLEIDQRSADSPPMKATLTANADADLKAQTLVVSPLKLEMPGLPMEGDLRVSQLDTQPMFTGTLRAAAFNPRALLDQFMEEKLETADPEVLKHGALSLAFKGTTERVQLTPVALTLDQTELKGNADLGLGEKTSIALRLQGNSMDLDRYLPPEAKDKDKPKSDKDDKDKEAAAEAALFPVESLRALNLDANVKFDQLKLNGILMNGVGLIMSARDGLVQITPLDVKMFEGAASTQARLDVRGAAPTVTFKTVLDSVRMGPLLRELTGDDYLTGLGKVEIDVTSRGMVMDDILRQMNGNIRVALNDGSVRDSKLASKIATAIEFIKQGRADYKEGGIQGALVGAAKARLEQPSPETQAAGVTQEETKFTQLNGTFQIVQGVMRNQDLNLVSGLVLANGGGTVDLGGSTADYVLKVGLNEGGKPRGGRYAPITIKGPFDKLSYSLDLTALAREEAKQQIEQRQDEVIEKVQEKLQDKVPGQILDALPGFFKKPAQQPPAEPSE